MNSEFWYLIVGAILAVAGGWISDEIRAWRERERELKSIKIAIGDELGEIKTTISNMHEVWKQAKVLSPSYITNLLANTTAFDNLRTRLFLIKDENLRKRVVAFYKKLKDTGKNSKGKIGTLANTDEAKAEQGQFDTEFQTLCTEAEAIKKSIEK
ncbi:MAG: hypothetical protein WCW56_02750 [Candidatus Paceibacterota bacterium]|jgi:hypothetical protein